MRLRRINPKRLVLAIVLVIVLVLVLVIENLSFANRIEFTTKDSKMKSRRCASGAKMEMEILGSFVGRC